MANCETCDTDMLTADTCTPRPDAVVYGSEILIEDGEEPHDYADRCHDCNVTLGSTHHFACDTEWCAPCGEQRLFCEHTFAVLESHGSPQVPNV